MKTLYLDTAYNQIVGICDERGQWLGLEQSSGQRSSSRLHGELLELCQTTSTEANELRRIIYLAGPGFYTGLRVSYGIAETMKLMGVKAFNCYAFQVPRILGRSEYTWITKAYRGEVFVYDSVSDEGKLWSEDNFLARDWEGELYIHHKQALDEKMLAKLPSCQSTQKLILDNFPTIQKAVMERAELPLHYFRAPEEEFRPNP